MFDRAQSIEQVPELASGAHRCRFHHDSLPNHHCGRPKSHTGVASDLMAAIKHNELWLQPCIRQELLDILVATLDYCHERGRVGCRILPYRGDRSSDRPARGALAREKQDKAALGLIWKKITSAERAIHLCSERDGLRLIIEIHSLSDLRYLLDHLNQDQPFDNGDNSQKDHRDDEDTRQSAHHHGHAAFPRRRRAWLIIEETVGRTATMQQEAMRARPSDHVASNSIPAGSR